MKINPNFKKVAILAVKRAGKILKANFGKSLKVDFKRDRTLLTETDLKAERAIIQLIKKNFPSHDILAEETGGKIGNGYTWVIDPLDGTTNYILGLPFFSISLALLRKKKPILGLVSNPLMNELYSVEKGKGAFLNQKKISVNKINNLSRVLLSFDKGKDLVGGLKVLIKIAPFIRAVRSWGSISLNECQVASGKIEGAIARKPSYHDTAAVSLLVEEAGGKVTDLKGKKYIPNSKGIVITNGKIHKKILKLINKK